VLRALTRMMWLVFLTAAQLTSQPLFALDAPAAPRPSFMAPLPPVRPAEPAGVPAPAQSPPAPQVRRADRGTNASSGSAIAAASFAASVPQADARMRLEWQKMKESGAAADKIWYDFAKVCLTK